MNSARSGLETPTRISAAGNGSQLRARVVVLRLQPLRDVSFVPILEPAVRIGDGVAEKGLGDVMALGGGGPVCARDGAGVRSNAITPSDR